MKAETIGRWTNFNEGERMKERGFMKNFAGTLRKTLLMALLLVGLMGISNGQDAVSAAEKTIFPKMLHNIR